MPISMVAARILAPHTKLATTRWWHTTTLPEQYGVVATDEDDLYAAQDWLLERQPHIEKKLAARHPDYPGERLVACRIPQLGCAQRSAPDSPTFQLLTTPTAAQHHAFKRLQGIAVQTETEHQKTSQITPVSAE